MSFVGSVIGFFDDYNERHNAGKAIMHVAFTVTVGTVAAGLIGAAIIFAGITLPVWLVVGIVTLGSAAIAEAIYSKVKVVHNSLDYIGQKITERFNKTIEEDKGRPGYTVPKMNGGYTFVPTN